VLNASYRGAPKWTYPAPVDDLKQALRWLRAHAREYAIDPQRVATFGYSAGGHLSELIGLMDGPAETRVQAVVAGGAPSDLTLFADDSRLVNNFMGARREKIPESYRAASPIHEVSAKNPPVFLYHATGDRLVPREHTEIMAAALTAAGVPHEIYWIKGRGHITGFIWDSGAEEAAITFLDRVLRAL
jgi:acetyl esterase/lipase